jgi:hypothetical protein
MLDNSFLYIQVVHVPVLVLFEHPLGTDDTYRPNIIHDLKKNEISAKKNSPIGISRSQFSTKHHIKPFSTENLLMLKFQTSCRL